ncbi:MAG: carboxypeptidase-like regulatory domain-containing protein [Flavobacteriales bacterium]|nr:carboxypeptidase-like regulatory domain-containing protein [Flavobacteriales bacterium]
MPIRQFPRTNYQRIAALQTIKDKIDNPLITSHPFKAATVQQLMDFYPEYVNLLHDLRVAKGEQTGTTSEVKQLRKMARIWVRQGYSSIIKAVVRGTFNRSVLNYYGLPLSTKGAPKMTSESDILSAAVALHEGETNRVAAGGEPIAFPSVAEIMVHANAFKAVNLDQGTRKDFFGDVQKAIAVANVEADRLILKLWNEIETDFNTGEAPKMRRKAREWGVVYVSGRRETPTAETSSVMGFITDEHTGKPLRRVRVRVNGVYDRIKSNANGRYSLPLLQAGEHVVLFQHKSYAPLAQTITVIAGEMAVLNIQLAEKEAAAGK